MNQRTVDLDQGRSALPVRAIDALASVSVGQVLRGRYLLKERVGSGGNGTVFKALDRLRATLPEAHRYVALKVLSAGGNCSEQTLANLHQEFYCAQSLSHRNIVNVYELDCDGDVIFFTMEMLDGEPLAKVFERLRPAALRRSQAWQLIHQLAAGVAHAHERGVVHGDLKPQNIVITRAGELRILDFGAAHQFGTESAPTCGTRAYASCEQLEGRPADPRDDLYALACICYELLAGTHPFDSRPATLARDYQVSLTRPPGLGGRQWRTLRKGLSWHRAGRSISVRLWMRRLLNGEEREESLTRLQELTRSNQAQSSVPWRAVALSFSVLTLFTAAVLTQPKLISALRMDKRATSSPPVVEDRGAAPSQPTLSAQHTVPAQPDDPPASDFLVTQASAPPKAPRPVSSAISVEPSQVRSDDHFAEIRLHRNYLQKDSSFTWWTEPATAKPDVDYVPETVAVQTFPSGFHGARLYVRLLPQPLRSHPSYFYIAITQPSKQGHSTVIRRQIWLPTSSSLQAQR